MLVLVKKEKNTTRAKLYLLQFFPVVVTVSNYHGPELCGLEEFQDFPSTHFQEASGKGRVPLMDGEVEDVIYVGFNKFFPSAPRESRQRKALLVIYLSSSNAKFSCFCLQCVLQA